MRLLISALCAALLSGCAAGSAETEGKGSHPVVDRSRVSRAPSADEPQQDGLSTGFRIPDARARAAALGDRTAIPAEIESFFAPAGFEPVPTPGPGDWLHEHKEAGQSFPQYLADHPMKPSGTRRTIYLLPIGKMDRRFPALEVLSNFSKLYFGLDTAVLPALSVEELGATSRENGGHRQLLTPDILDHLKTVLPSDAFCLIGVTAEDLYPDPTWNFVFGQATFHDRVGVYSLARYHPSFHGDASAPADASLVLRRSLKVMSHEIGHMLTMKHCTYYQCVMNGSNGMHETDARPGRVCPICLRKLHHSLGFDPAERYRKLKAFYRRHGLEAEAEWIAARIKANKADPL